MLLQEYLGTKEQNRRILIVSNLNIGQELIRQHEAVTGQLIRNVTCMTLSQMLELVFLYLQAEKGFEQSYALVNATEALLIFRSVIFENISSLKYFNKEKMMNLVTTKEMFDKANLIRNLGWSGEENKVSNDRVTDMKFLIDAYEKKLEAKESLDEIGLYTYVLTEMQQWENTEKELLAVFSAEISFLEEAVENISGRQKKFLEILQNEGKAAAISLYEKQPSVVDLMENKEHIFFFKGYGSYNEVSYVANDILSKNIPFGNVTVLYSSANQLPTIASAFSGNNLPMKMISRHPAKDNPYISMAKRILTWAKEEYSEKALENILSSDVACLKVEDSEGEEQNVLAKQSYFDYVLNAAKRRENSFIFGWGYERNAQFLEHEEKMACDDEVTKSLLQMHKELLNVFGDGEKPYCDDDKLLPIVIYEKLVHFMENYTRPTQEYATGMEAIKQLANAIKMEERKQGLLDNLVLIEELLDSISVRDNVSNDAIKVQCIQDMLVLERPYVYVIGLSLKDMQGSTTESPILLDEEMNRFLLEGYKPTVRKKAQQKEINIYRTLKTFKGKELSFGYSDYDTIGFCESNPSTIFRELLQKLKGDDVRKLPEFVYGNPTKDVEFSAKNNPKKGEYEIKLSTSNSAIESLLDCPKKYAYEKQLYVPDNEFLQSNYEKWLDSRLRGSFFHELAERYVENKLIKPIGEKYDAQVDEELVKTIAQDIHEKMLLQMPVAFAGLAERETNELVKNGIAYFGRLHASLLNDGWRVLFVEKEFVDSEYLIEDYEKKAYNFVFSGIIDRIDYGINKELETIFLRIVDYKTGRKSNKEKENKLGKLLQYAVYKKALMETGHYLDENDVEHPFLDLVKERVAQLEGNDAIKNWKFEFSGFEYVFPMETLDTTPVVISDRQLEDVNLTRLKCILTAVSQKNMFPDHLDLYDIVKEYEGEYGSADDLLGILKGNMERRDRNGKVLGISNDEIKNCSYCSYADLCEHRKAGDL